MARLAVIEREAIDQALAASNGNISQAARRLGISRNTLYRKLGRL
jgi:transcriptional regulator of acetoin/glycerol metabolism